MGGDALELALALYRAPIQRFALRGRALPGDIGVVIHLASGTQPFLREAATRRCESEETILEAARFYLQQVLFEPESDAYRVLGLAPGAQPERIREHYHWLQSWLHPDRRGEDWEALLATRVNWAWQHLRNEAGRSAYGMERERSVAKKFDNPDAGALLPTGKWKAIPLARPPGRWSKRIALGLSVGSCVGLLVLALTGLDPMPDDAAIGHSATVAALPANTNESHVTTPAAPWSMGTQVAAESVSEPSLPQLNHGPDVIPTATSPTTPNATSMNATSMLAGSPKPVPVATPAAPGMAAIMPPISMSRVPQMPLRPAPTTVTNRTPVAAVVRQEDDASAASRKFDVVVSHEAVPAAPGAVAAVAPRLHVDTTSTAATMPAIKPPATVLSATAVAGLGAESDQARLATSPPKRASVSVNGIASNVAQASPDRSKQEFAVAPDARAIFQTSGTSASAVDNQQQSTRPLAQPLPDTSLSSPDALARMELAHQRVKEVATYFGRFHSVPPPVWNDATGQTGAERQRNALHDRARLPSAGDFEVDAPTWRMSGVSAALNAGYRLRTGRGVSESGRLSLDMVWREKMWLVTRVELEPAL